MKVKLIKYMMPDIVDIWNITKSKEEQKEKSLTGLESLLIMDLPLNEYIMFIFLIENAPIAFREQLVRHRIGVAYWIQSARVTDYTKEFNYYIPKLENETQEKVYHVAMEYIHESYKQLIKNGVHPEKARYILSVGMLHTISMCINFRMLKSILRTRSCFVMQGDLWKPFYNGVISELKKYKELEICIKFLSLKPCEEIVNGKKIWKGCKRDLINRERMKKTRVFDIPCPVWLKNSKG